MYHRMGGWEKKKGMNERRKNKRNINDIGEKNGKNKQRERILPTSSLTTKKDQLFGQETRWRIV